MKTHNVGVTMERAAVDIFGPVPISNQGNKYILVVGDYFTKWTEAYPLPNQEASTVATVSVEQFVYRYNFIPTKDVTLSHNFLRKFVSCLVFLRLEHQLCILNQTFISRLKPYVEENIPTWFQDSRMMSRPGIITETNFQEHPGRENPSSEETIDGIENEQLEEQKYPNVQGTRCT